MTCNSNFKTIIILVILLIITFLVIKHIFKKKSKEHFFMNKIDLKKKVIVVIMKDVFPDHIYKSFNNNNCSKLINDCSLIFDKDKVSSKQKINVTNDVSLNTSKKKKNISYVVIYKNKKSNDYNKKFIKKWCNDKNKSKNNFVVIDYDDIFVNSHEIIQELSSKLDINFDISSIMSSFV